MWLIRICHIRIKRTRILAPILFRLLSFLPLGELFMNSFDFEGRESSYADFYLLEGVSAPNVQVAHGSTVYVKAHLGLCFQNVGLPNLAFTDRSSSEWSASSSQYAL